MHLVTLLFLASVVVQATGIRRLPTTDAARQAIGRSGLGLARRLRELSLGAGVLGSLFGLMAGFTRGHESGEGVLGSVAVAIIPSTWALLLIGAASLVVAIMRHRAVGAIQH